MKLTCSEHMCDGSGWRQPSWPERLPRPCYCEAGRALKEQEAELYEAVRIASEAATAAHHAERVAERAAQTEPEQPKQQKPLNIEEPAAAMRAQLAALRGA